MKITNNADNIRQQQPGQFRRPADGTEPYAYVNDQKLESREDQKASSVYVDNEKVATLLEKEKESRSPNLFDFNAGLKLGTETTTRETKEVEETEQQYDESGKTITLNKQEGLVDEWV